MKKDEKCDQKLEVISPTIEESYRSCREECNACERTDITYDEKIEECPSYCSPTRKVFSKEVSSHDQEKELLYIRDSWNMQHLTREYRKESDKWENHYKDTE